MSVKKINGVSINISALAGMTKGQIMDMELFHSDIDASLEKLFSHMDVFKPETAKQGKKKAE